MHALALFSRLAAQFLKQLPPLLPASGIEDMHHAFGIQLHPRECVAPQSKLFDAALHGDRHVPPSSRPVKAARQDHLVVGTESNKLNCRAVSTHGQIPLVALPAMNEPGQESHLQQGSSPSRLADSLVWEYNS